MAGSKAMKKMGQLSVTSAEICEFKRRWRLDQEPSIAELRAMTSEEKLYRMIALTELARATGCLEQSEGDVEQVRRKWVRLKEAYAAQQATLPSPLATPRLSKRKPK